MSRPIKILLIVGIMVILTGAVLISYPTIRHILYDIQAKQQAAEFDSWREEMADGGTDEEQDSDGEADASDGEAEASSGEELGEDADGQDSLEASDGGDDTGSTGSEEGTVSGEGTDSEEDGESGGVGSDTGVAQEGAEAQTDKNGVDELRSAVSVAYLQELYEAMQEYNLDIYENGQSGFRDAWSYQVPSFDLTKWGFDENVIGYIDIPQMDITLPVYLGANAEHMELGAAHLSQTSLPIGGNNTNAVIAAHRGEEYGRMFRDIENLQIGDRITMANLWEDLTYEVTEIKIIDPTDTHEVLIQEGRDMITLLTCHPYPYTYQRYVVYCERVE